MYEILFDTEVPENISHSYPFFHIHIQLKLANILSKFLNFNLDLKRFSPTERFRGKLSVTVDFPLEGLDMSKYAAEEATVSKYNLYAVSNHSGTTYSGHYTAYCRHPYAMSWHEYNDSR